MKYSKQEQRVIEILRMFIEYEINQFKTAAALGISRAQLRAALSLYIGHSEEDDVGARVLQKLIGDKREGLEEIRAAAIKLYEKFMYTYAGRMQ